MKRTNVLMEEHVNRSQETVLNSHVCVKDAIQGKDVKYVSIKMEHSLSNVESDKDESGLMGEFGLKDIAYYKGKNVA